MSQPARLTLLLTVAAAMLAGPLAVAAVPLSSDALGALGPKGPMPGEVWQALERPRPRPAVSRGAAPGLRDAVAEEPELPAPPPTPAVLPTHTPAGGPVYFAGVAGMQLRLPGGVTGVGFHESGTRGALPLHPVGRPSHNDNMTKLASAPVDPVGGTTYAIMGSRGRRGGPTTAVDVAMRPGWPVQSPVTGTVELVQGYRLYGRTPDYLVQVVPDARPDLRVRLLHLDVVHVPVGHRVVAGETIVAGTARPLPVSNQVDRYAGHGPHVHVEIVPG